MFLPVFEFADSDAAFVYDAMFPKPHTLRIVLDHS